MGSNGAVVRQVASNETQQKEQFSQGNRSFLLCLVMYRDTLKE